MSNQANIFSVVGKMMRIHVYFNFFQIKLLSSYMHVRA